MENEIKSLAVVSLNGHISVCICPVIAKIAQGFSRDSGISRCEYTFQAVKLWCRMTGQQKRGKERSF